MKGSFGALVAALVLHGCGGRVVRGDLAAAAGKGLGCAADEVTIDEPSKEQLRLLQLAGAPTQAYTRGCGKRLVYARMCKADGSACDWYSVKQLRVDQLLERVTFDMKCAKEQVTTRQLTPATVGVSGCGQQATYVWSCPHNQDFFSGACNWVLNSDTRPAARSAVQ